MQYFDVSKLKSVKNWFRRLKFVKIVNFVKFLKFAKCEFSTYVAKRRHAQHSTYVQQGKR